MFSPKMFSRHHSVISFSLSFEFRWNTSDSRLTIFKTRLRRQMRFLRPNIGRKCIAEYVHVAPSLSSLILEWNSSAMIAVSWLNRGGTRIKAIYITDKRHTSRKGRLGFWPLFTADIIMNDISYLFFLKICLLFSNNTIDIFVLSENKRHILRKKR